MKTNQEILNKPIIKKPSEEQIQSEIERILDEQLKKNRFLKFNFEKTTSSKKSRQT